MQRLSLGIARHLNDQCPLAVTGGLTCKHTWACHSIWMKDEGGCLRRVAVMVAVIAYQHFVTAV